MAERRVFDVVVIGGGPAGENAAAYAVAGGGRTAALVERELVGGECSYWACMPSKALLWPGEVLAQARAMPGVRGLVDGRPLDVSAVLARRDAFTNGHDDSGQVDWARSAGIEVIRGHGRLVGDRTVEVDRPGGALELHAREAVVLATGSAATVPPVAGLAEALPWTSRDVTNLHEVPERVLVLGGGVVACESATWLLALGVRELTMVVRGASLLARSEPWAGERVVERLRELGARILFETELGSVRRAAPGASGEGWVHGGPATVSLGTATDAETVTVDEIVVAAGRRPGTADLGLESVGLTRGRALDTDDHLAVAGVAGGWLYAVGDVNGRAALTHMGKYQGRVCGDVIAARAAGRALDGPRYTASADRTQTPQVVFTDPQVGSVGLTEQQARANGLAVESVSVDIAVAGSALHNDGYRGRAQLVLDGATDTVVGATFVGPDIAELVHAATVAVVGRVPLERLWHAVPSYPTMSEVWLRLLEARRG
ncbi:NAD(P)/FAD-dependent oxidoreductase [Rhodococcus sp. D2-41]|uniref:dihydrolipoyl dehydrogenase family protein n=1 Tax=Speluncibacter jeojiensis TaxID=2710754 RepID=UPI00240EE015|nr:NAD(P)/FAD-dependent oxidoreductase [Rhodococcus sp. D2-41]MDG3012208.1 NAD(P)/FAD-dependent oxidoreductase [Rhodococcus sp. D2-41]